MRFCVALAAVTYYRSQITDAQLTKFVAGLMCAVALALDIKELIQ